MPEPVELLEGSGKVAITVDLLRTVAAQGEKVLVFSQSLFTLDVLEQALGSLPVVEKGTGETWSKGREYYRLDGSTPSTARQKLVERFNDPSNTDVKCVLISTKAGSLGINLPAANRVVIFDGSWNPTHDLQAMFRAWRFGQTKPVFVYRLLACGTMEENIYARQVTKESLSARVIDEQQVANHFSNQELESLYNLDEDDDDYVPEEPPSKSQTSGPPPKGNGAATREATGAAETVAGAEGGGSGMNAEEGGSGTKADEAAKEAIRRGVKEFAIPDNAPPSDDVLARVLLRNRPKWIVRYHEHDVLLQDKELEHLDEREKALAWKEHEEAVIRESQPGLTQYEVNLQLLYKELHQVQTNPALTDEEKRLAMRPINNNIIVQKNLQAQLELQERHRAAEQLRAAQAQQQAAQAGPSGVPTPRVVPPAPSERKTAHVTTGGGVADQGKQNGQTGAGRDDPPVQKVPVGRVPVDKVPVEKVPADRVPLDRVPIEKVPVRTPVSADREREKQEYARRMALYAKMGR